jgi:hypothetical protein
VTEAHVESDMRKHSRPSAELTVVVSDAVNKVTAGLRRSPAGASGGQPPPAAYPVAFLRSDLLFEVGEVLNLNIEVPGARTLVARCRVEGISRGTGGETQTGMAVALVDLSPASRTTLESALR